jgi:hypothetical protein
MNDDGAAVRQWQNVCRPHLDGETIVSLDVSPADLAANYPHQS